MNSKARAASQPLGIAGSLRPSLAFVAEQSRRLQQFIHETGVNGDSGRHLDPISTSCSEILHSVCSMLDLVMLEEGSLNLFEQELGVQEILEQVYLDNCGLARKRNVSLVMSNEAPGAAIFADARRVRQILTGLLYHRLDALAAGCNVRLGARVCRGAELVMYTSDDGPSFEPDPKVSLQQPEAGRSAAGSHALADLHWPIAERLAELMNCEMLTDHEFGGRTEFRLLMPDSRTRFAEGRVAI